MCDAVSLCDVNDTDVEYFTYRGRVMDVKITNVYDGDTFTGCFWDAGTLRKYKFRCNGYDSGELRQPKDREDREQAKAKGQMDRQYFMDLVDRHTNGTRVIACLMGDFDKYGRILADLPADGAINREMISSGHGYVYNGGTKQIN